MGQLTPTFLFAVEKRMRIISAAEYQRLNNNVYWTQVAKELTSSGRSERLIWLLDTAHIQYQDRIGGSVEFEDMLSTTTEFTTKSASGGLVLNRFQMDDNDGGGLEVATAWARQMGEYAAYWPQKQVATAMRVGGAAASKTYDGQVFFSGSHPVNVFDTSLGTFANDFTGGASGSFPGACPIDTTNAASLDIALANLQKIQAYIQSIKMPNGEDPRGLKFKAIIHPPALTARVQALTEAKFIGGAATGGVAGGSGSSDIEAVIRKFGFGTPIEAPELGASMTSGSDTTFYVLAEAAMGDQLGALIYVNRDPFEVVYNSGMTSDALQRANQLQWTTRGRNVVGYGHPYLLFRCQAT